MNDASAAKVFFFFLACTGHVGLWMALLTDTGATLPVIAHALRLLK